MGSTTPERDPQTGSDPGAEFAPDPEESTGDPLEPIPQDGRDGQPAEGSSDDAATMAQDDPLREPEHAAAEELPFVEDEVDELEDSGDLDDPAADRLANESIAGEQHGNLDEQLADDAEGDLGGLADPEAEDPGLDEDLSEELGEDPDSASN